MTVKGKKAYKVYLTEKNTKFVKSFLESNKTKGGLSLLFDKFITKTARIIRKNQYLAVKKFD